MNTPTNLAKKVALVSIWVLLAAGLMALSPIEEGRVLSLLVVAVAIAGSLLVLYFDWRGRLLRRVRSDRDSLERGSTQCCRAKGLPAGE